MTPRSRLALLLAAAILVCAPLHLRVDWPTAQASVALAWKAIGLLVAGPAAALFLFSRIEGKEILEHATRTRIRELVRDRPGVGLSEVCAELRLGWGTTVYHLNRLEGAGLLVSASAGRKRAFFLPEHGRVTRGAMTILNRDAQRRMLEYVHRRPGASQRELAAAGQLSLPLAHRYLRQLEDEGLVVSEKSWRTRAYKPTSALVDYLGEHALRQRSTPVDAPDDGSACASVGGTHQP